MDGNSLGSNNGTELGLPLGISESTEDGASNIVLYGYLDGTAYMER